MNKHIIQNNIKNICISITNNQNEFITFINLINNKNNKNLANEYQVIYGDIYNTIFDFYNNFDIINLCHICEYSNDEKNGYYKDFILIKNLINILKKDGLILFSKKNNYFEGQISTIFKNNKEKISLESIANNENIIPSLINKLILDKSIELDFKEITDDFVILIKKYPVNNIFSFINYSENLYNKNFDKDKNIIDKLQNCKFYKTQKIKYNNALYLDKYIKVDIFLEELEQNLLIVAHPDDEIIFGVGPGIHRDSKKYYF